MPKRTNVNTVQPVACDTGLKPESTRGIDEAKDDELLVIEQELGIESLTGKCLTTQNYLKDILLVLTDGPLRRTLNDAIKLPIGKKCTIAVIGPTNSGKSSLICALLGRKTFLPAEANGEAVTAVPVRLSYQAFGRYRYEATISYMSESEWRRKLEQVQSHLDDRDKEDRVGERLLRQVQACYPHLSVEDLEDMTIDEILDENDFDQLFGTTAKGIQNDDEETFQDLLQPYVAPPSRPSGAKYVLIRDVTVTTNSEILKAFDIIDVPGTGDAIAARADRCHECLDVSDIVCIAAPSDRAIDNSLARALISSSLKHFYSINAMDRVISLATKSDQFDVKKVPKQLKLDKVMSIRKDLDSARSSLNVLSDDLASTQLDLAEEKAEIGKLEKFLTNWKSAQVRVQTQSHWKNVQPPLCSKTSDIFDTIEISRPLDLKSCQNAIRKVESEISSKQRRSDLLTRRLPSFELKRKQKEAEIAALELQGRRLALKGRNDVIKKGMIGVCQELVEECLESRQEVEISTYQYHDSAEKDTIREKLGEQIKVFAVSGQAYQDLEQLEILEDSQRVIETVDDTEIPALIKCLKKKALATRFEHAEAMDNKLSLVLGSLKEHCREQSLLQISEGSVELFEFKMVLENLKQSLPRCTISATSSVLSRRKGTIGDIRDDALLGIVTQAVTRIAKYARPPQTSRLGLYAGQWKALCSRNGEYTTGGQKQLGVNLNKIVGDTVCEWSERALNELLISTGTYAGNPSGQCIAKDVMDTSQADVYDILEGVHRRFAKVCKVRRVSAATTANMERQYELRRRDIIYTMNMAKQQF